MNCVWWSVYIFYGFDIQEGIAICDRYGKFKSCLLTWSVFNVTECEGINVEFGIPFFLGVIFIIPCLLPIYFAEFADSHIERPRIETVL